MFAVGLSKELDQVYIGHFTKELAMDASPYISIVLSSLGLRVLEPLLPKLRKLEEVQRCGYFDRNEEKRTKLTSCFRFIFFMLVIIFAGRVAGTLPPYVQPVLLVVVLVAGMVGSYELARFFCPADHISPEEFKDDIEGGIRKTLTSHPDFLGKLEGVSDKERRKWARLLRSFSD